MLADPDVVIILRSLHVLSTDVSECGSRNHILQLPFAHGIEFYVETKQKLI